MLVDPTNFQRLLLFTQKRFVDLENGKLALSALHLTKAINRKKEIVFILSYLVANSEIKAFAKTYAKYWKYVVKFVFIILFCFVITVEFDNLDSFSSL